MRKRQVQQALLSVAVLAFVPANIFRRHFVGITERVNARIAQLMAMGPHTLSNGPTVDLILATVGCVIGGASVSHTLADCKAFGRRKRKKHRRQNREPWHCSLRDFCPDA
jgi:hypothetical protein